MNQQTKDIAKEAFATAKANGLQVCVFWQDHFYARGRYFGYPVCIQLQNVAENHVEDARIVHWSSWKQVCEVWVDQIDAYLAELEAEWQQAAQPVGEGSTS